MKDQQAGGYKPTGTYMQRQSPTGGIGVLLWQALICLGNSIYTDDLDAFSFSLNQLFRRVDFLYREALPGLGATLSDAIEGILDTLDAASDVFSFHAGIGSLEDVPAAGFAQDRGYPIPTGPIDDEQWDSAFSAVLQSLKSWQQSYRTSTSFAIQFSGLNEAAGGLAIPEKDHSQEVPLDRLDAVFVTLLEGACAIFGDILPAFRTSAANDDESTATLLFDLMQQSDHLLLELDATLECLSGLIEDFTLGPRPAIGEESIEP